MSENEKHKSGYNSKALPADVNYDYLQLPGGYWGRIDKPEDKIEYIRGAKAYCDIHFVESENKSDRTESFSLCEMMRKMNPLYFFRGHKSFIYCMKVIRNWWYNFDYIVIKLKNCNQYNVSEPYMALFEALLPHFPEITRL